MSWKKHLPLTCLVLSIFATPAAAVLCDEPAAPAATTPDDREALRGISVGRILWDVTLADPAQLLARLGIIEQTYQDMVRQNVTPEMIFAFRGGAIRLLAADPDKIKPEHRSAAAEVQVKLRELLARPGVRMEACHIAMRRAPLEPSDLMPGIHAVGNTFLSAVGYGQKGFVAIPIN